MIQIGDFFAGDTVLRVFTSINAVGVPTALTNTPAYQVMKNASATFSSAGVTLTQGINSLPGLNCVTIDTSADGTFYAAGNDYTIIETAGNQGGAPLSGYAIASFSIQNRTGLRASVKGRTLAISAAGQAGLDWANIGSPTTVQGLSGTTIKDATDIETKLGTPSVSIAADIATRAPSSTAVSNVDYTSARAAKIDNLDAAVSTRLPTSSYVGPDNTSVAAIKAKTDNLPSDPASNTQVNTRVATSDSRLAHLDVDVSSRLASGSYTAPDNTGIAAIKAKTDNLPASPASEGNVTAVGNAVAQIPTNPLLTNDARLNHLDADISSRLPTSSYVAPDNADVAAIKVQTDKMLFDGSSNIKANAEVVSDKVGYTPDTGTTATLGQIKSLATAGL